MSPTDLAEYACRPSSLAGVSGNQPATATPASNWKVNTNSAHLQWSARTTRSQVFVDMVLQLLPSVNRAVPLANGSLGDVGACSTTYNHKSRNW